MATYHRPIQTPDHRMAIGASRLGIPLEEYRSRVESGEKWCSYHHAWHPRAAFGANAAARDGLNAACLEGARERARNGMRNLQARRRAEEGFPDTHEPSDARFATLLGESGTPPCDPPDDCTVCVLFDRQRPGESRGAWLARIRDGAKWWRP